MRIGINFGICFLHLLFLLLLLFAPQMSFKHQQKKPLTIRNCTPAPVVKETNILAKTVQSQAKVAAAAAPKPALRPTTKKINAPSSSPPKQKTVRPNSALSSLAKELDKTIAQMQMNSSKKQLAPELKIARLHIDTPEKEENNNYVISLTHYLHTALHLPDFGQVKMQLTVRQDGTIAKLLVIKAESEENRKYLEKHIPLLHFPPLQGEYAKDSTHTFVLAFCNEL